MDIQSLLALLLQLSSYLPLLLIYSVGLAIAATRLTHQRRFAWLCIAGFCCHLLGLMISAGSQLWLTYAAQTQQLSGSNATNISVAIGFAQLVVVLIACSGWVLLLIALFSGRMQKNEEPAASQET